MDTIWQVVALVFCGAVGLILFRGLWNMASDGSPTKSQALMRMRVTAQAVAVIVLVAIVYFFRPN